MAPSLISIKHSCIKGILEAHLAIGGPCGVIYPGCGTSYDSSLLSALCSNVVSLSGKLDHRFDGSFIASI